MNGYVAAGYGATLLTLAGYAVHVLRRARTLQARAASSAAVHHRDGVRR